MSAAELLSGLYDAFGRGDIPSVLGAMDPGIRWHEAEGNPYMPSGEAWTGPEAILNNLFMKRGGDWDDFAVRTDAFHDSGDVVAVEGRYTGRYKESGKRIDAQFCHVWSVKDGKVTKFQQYTDTGAFQDVMGARSS